MRPYFYRDRWLEYAVAAGGAVILIALHIIGLLRPVEDIAVLALSPIARAVYVAESGVGNVFVNIFSDKQVQIDALTSQVADLTSQVADLTRVQDENVTLRRQLGVQAKHASQRVLVHVLGEHPTASFSKRLLIDAGIRDGVAIGDPAVMDGALVGFVTGAEDTVSEVMLITDPNSSVPAYIQSTQATGLAKGDIGFARVTLTQVDRGSRLAKGDKVLTSGENALSKDILIGEVDAILTVDRDPVQTVEVKPAADLRTISTLFIVTS